MSEIDQSSDSRKSVATNSEDIDLLKSASEIIDNAAESEKLTAANSSNLVTVQSGDIGRQTEVKKGSLRFVLTGLFGGLKAGAGGTSVVNFAKAEVAIPTGKDKGSTTGFTANNARIEGKNIDNGLKLDGTFQAITGGFGLKSVFTYDQSINNPLSLKSYIENQSAGLGFIRHQSKRYDTGGKIQVTGGFNVGGIWEER